MSDVGEISIVARATTNMIDRDMRVVERKVVEKGDKIEKRLAQAISFGMIAASVRAATAAAEIAFAGFEYITARIEGNLSKAYEAAESFAVRLKRVPIVGDAFKLGQFLGSGGIDDDAESARIQQEVAEAERSRMQQVKTAEEAQKRLLQLRRETALLEAKGDEERTRRLQADFKFDDATTDIAKFNPETQAQILALANQRRRLESQAEVPKLAQEINARSILSQQPQQDAPKAKQIDTTNQLLLNIARVIAQRENGAFAQ